MIDQRGLTYEEITTSAESHYADALWFQHHGNLHMAHAAMIRALLELSSLPNDIYMRYAKPVIREIQVIEAVIKNAQ